MSRLRPRRLAWALAAALGTLVPALHALEPPAPAWADAVEVIKEEGVEAQLVEGRSIHLIVLPEKGDGYISLTRRLCGKEQPWQRLAAANDDRPVIVGRPVTVPWNMLREEYRYLALLALFPEDRSTPEGWLHHPAAASVESYGEGLWQVAEWFTGDGGKWREIAAANSLSGPDLPRHRAILVPAGLLSPLFRHVERSSDGRLVYREDDQGPYAEYRLRRREALYSAVVLRFTSLTEPADVVEAAERIARRSGIRDVKKIPVNFPVKIPLEMLGLEALPSNHPQRVAARILRSEMAQVVMPRRSRSLAGVQVLLDPGHGGKDLGAIRNNIWESDYVYDVACRVKRELEKRTAAEVHILVHDTQYGCRIFDRKTLPKNRREVVQTSPPHRVRGGASTKMGVNLRWYLANRIFSDLRRKKVPAENVVFISLHADSLHHAIRGAMVYVPGERYRKGRYRVHGGSYRRYKEVKAAKTISFGRKQRLHDEAVSRRLAEAILAGYRKEKLPVHSHQPIRDHITKRVRRRTRRYAPAVLRANRVPAKVLLETVNINNKADARLMADPAGRERMARAIVEGLERFYAGR
ncbi:MAG: N-acetylmuramoyl-L-alanine amidase [Acidobacteriota bacterium]|nr:N-acetylmuramoyl-L-alanine amidase [Acidobacteriota bacterium]